MDIAFLILKILGLFAVLLIGAIFLIPRILHREKLWRSKGSIEGITTAIFFGIAGIAAYVGLSPIVGAFAAGMAVASTKLIKQVEEYAHKLQFIFAPLFFAIIGAQVDLRGVNIRCFDNFWNNHSNSNFHKVSRMWVTIDVYFSRIKQDR